MGRKRNITVDKDIPFLRGVLDAYAHVAYLKGSEIRAENIFDADALIIRTRTRCDEKLLANTKVTFIATATIGTDHIDDTYCIREGIQWQNAPGCNSGSVMQYLASALVKLAGKYQLDFTKTTLGVIGHGNVGSKVARMARLLGMEVLVNDPPLQRKGVAGKYHTLEQIRQQADIISFHVPLNPDGPDKTFHLADSAFLNGLKPDTILINTSRGEVVETRPLIKALQDKKIRGAVLDVWENEPDIDPELFRLVDYGTPHIAGYSADGKALGTAMSVQGVSRFFGLGLDDWIPENIPVAKDRTMKLENDGWEGTELLFQLILATYDLEEDHQRLKANLELFEQLRADYPVRREFGAYTYIPGKRNESSLKKIRELGFLIP